MIIGLVLKRVSVIVTSMTLGTAADSTFTFLAEKSNNRCEMELDVQEGMKEKLAAIAERTKEESEANVESQVSGAGEQQKIVGGASAQQRPRKVRKQASVDSGNEASSEDSNDSNKYDKGE